MSMWLGITNLSSSAQWASLIMGHVKKYSMEKRLAWPITLIKMKLKVGACGASDLGNSIRDLPGARDVKFVIPHAHAFVCASTPKDNVYVCMSIGM